MGWWGLVVIGAVVVVASGASQRSMTLWSLESPLDHAPTKAILSPSGMQLSTLIPKFLFGLEITFMETLSAL
ncbi:hypothetical protein SLA2020_429420 [Shorea laevis]